MKQARTVLAVCMVLVCADALKAAANPLDLFKEGKYAEAVAELTPLAEKHPDDPGVHYLLGMSYLKLEKLPEAEKSLARALELKKDQWEYPYWLANVQLQQKNYPQVVELLGIAELLSKDDHQRHGVLVMRGYAHAAQDHWAEAVRDLEASLALKKTAPILVQLGKAQYSLKDYRKAAVAFADAAALDPKDPDHFLLLANAQLALAAEAEGAEGAKGDEQKARYTEAMTAATRYQELKPGIDAATLRGKAAMGLGDFATAESEFGKALKEKPDACPTLSYLGRAYIEQKKWAEAEAQLELATACAPDNAGYFETLAFVYLSQDKVHKSLEAYQKANSIRPSESAQEGIAAAKSRIETQASLHTADKASAEYEAARRKADREYQEYLKKRQEWDKKRNESN